MNIQQNSWHYKFLLEWHLSDEMPKDLCTYVRHIFLLPLFFVCIGVFVGLLALSLLAAPIGMIYTWIVLGTLDWNFLFNSGLDFVSFGILAWIVIILSGIVIGFFEGLKRYSLYKLGLYKRGLPTSPPGLIRSRYRAWKLKVCPILDFRND